MKMQSDNIRAYAGILAVHNLNVFTDVDGQTAEAKFKEACRRAAIVGKMAMEHDTFGEEGKMDLVTLSIPRFETVDEGHYKLAGGIFVWANHFFKAGAEFRFRNGDLDFVTPELIEPAVAVRAKMEEIKYDTYNGAKLGEISDEILKELDLTLDKSKLAYAYLDDGEEGKTWDDVEEETGQEGFFAGYAEVKYMSIYAEALTGSELGRVIAYVQHDEATKYTDYRTPELGFDASYAKEILDSWKALYDNYLVEFIDTKQPFAYIAVELMGEPAKGAPAEAKPDTFGDDANYGDIFAAMFDKGNLENMRAFGVETAVENLSKIAGS